MKNKKFIQEELEDLNSFLAKKDLKDNFEIPNNYFEDFQNEVLQKLEQNDRFHTQEKAKVRKLNFRKVLPVAATVALLIGLFFFMKNDTVSDTLAMDQLSTTDIESYINENIDEFDIELLSMLQTEDQDLLMMDDLEVQDFFENNLDDLDDSLIDELF